ncbi:MAG: hypothetical protein BWY76_00719 [bacterium ADurb.Bin429]|nr:MAG: hypothetical protein BWY76_00719 [bacterium ADurb.Bin429]
MIEQRAAEIVGKISSLLEKVALAVSGGTAVLAKVTLSDWAFISGIFGTAITVTLSWYYQRRRDQREAERQKFDRARAQRDGIEVVYDDN